MAQPQRQKQRACSCLRCGRPCKVNPVAGSTANMLKKSSRPEGLCVNCGVHDVLRNLYPANVIVARSGPKGLALPHIQLQFFIIAQMAGTDAAFEEIDWQAIAANWDLPFPTPIRRTAKNPVTQEELDRARLEADYDPLLIETECQKHIEGVEREFLDHLGKRSCEDSPTDHRDGD